MKKEQLRLIFLYCTLKSGVRYGPNNAAHWNLMHKFVGHLLKRN